MTDSNWIDIGLSKDDERLVQEGAALYRAMHIETIDTVFKIANAIKILRESNYGSGSQGAFTRALMQYGFTNRAGTGPIDPSIRNKYHDLLVREAEVRAWWADVPEKKRKWWTSAKAIWDNYNRETKPRTQSPRPPTMQDDQAAGTGDQLAEHSPA